MPANPMLTTLLDLDAALPKQALIVGGGFGLFLKQTYIANNPELRTLFPLASLPRLAQLRTLISFCAQMSLQILPR